jgi:hypothetical protein
MSSNITSKKRFYEQQLYHASKIVKIDNEESWKRLKNILENDGKEGSNPVIDIPSVACYQGTYLDFGNTPLHNILEKNPPLDVVSTFVKKAPESLRVKNIHGELPIHVACQRGVTSEVLKALVQAYPEGAKVQSKFGLLPIHYACININSPREMIKLLIKTYQESVKVREYKCGMLPIHDACSNGASLEVMNLLISEWPDSLKVKDADEGWLPIHHACKYKASLEVLDSLVQVYPESLMVRSINSETPADIMKKHNSTIKEVDSCGKVLLHHAYEGGFSEHLVKLIVNAYPEGSSIMDHYGHTPVYYSKQQQQNHSLDAEQCTLYDTQTEELPSENQINLPVVTQAKTSTPEEAAVAQQGSNFSYNSALLKGTELINSISANISETENIKSEMKKMEAKILTMESERAREKAEVQQLKSFNSRLETEGIELKRETEQIKSEMKKIEVQILTMESERVKEKIETNQMKSRLSNLENLLNTFFGV